MMENINWVDFEQVFFFPALIFRMSLDESRRVGKLYVIAVDVVLPDFCRKFCFHWDSVEALFAIGCLLLNRCGSHRYVVLLYSSVLFVA